MAKAEEVKGETKDMIIPIQISVPEIFKGGGATPLIDAIKKEVSNFVPVTDTAKGRSEIASMAYKVARSKTYLDNLGKGLTADLKAQVAVVDAERKKIRDELDSLRDEVRAPLDAWEEAEKKRVAGIKERISMMELAGDAEYATSCAAQAILDRINAISLSEGFGEFVADAVKIKEQAVERLQGKVDKLLQREKDQAELERLRREEQERLLREEQERKAREEAERKAREEAERKAREEQIRIQQQKAVEEARAKAEKAAQEREARLLEEKRRLEENNARLEKIAKEKEQRQKEALEKAKLEAAERERKKIADDLARERAEAEKRERNKRIRAGIRRQAIEALIAAGLDTKQAQDVFAAIDRGEIPNITVNY